MAAILAVLVLGYVLLQLVSIGGERATPVPTAPPAATPASTAVAGSTAGAVQAETTAAPTPAPSATPSNGVSSHVQVLEPNYTVVAGDTLGKIAARSGNTVEALQGLNKLDDPRKLSVGQKLIVPQQ